MVEGIGGTSFPLKMPQELPGLPASAGRQAGSAADLENGAGTAGANQAGGAEGFASTFKQFLGEVNDLQNRSTDTMQAFVRGEVKDLHQVVLAQQEAAIALRLVGEMRDRLLSAYQEVMRTSM